MHGDFSLSQPEIFIGTAVFFVLFLCVAVLLAKKTHAEPYERLPSVLTPPEQQFYKALASAVQGRAIIMAKVRIADILKVRRGIPRNRFGGTFKNITEAHRFCPD